MLKLYVVRHGETSATREFRYEGRGDGDLTADGLLQARSAAEVLADAEIGSIYSSPRVRAMRTARVIGDRIGMTPVEAGGLAEADFGRWEGLTMDEIRLRDPDLLGLWLADPIRTRPPGGECLAEMWERVRRFCDELRVTQAAPVTRSIALVSHGGPIRALVSFCQVGDLSVFKNVTARPGEIKVLDYPF